jgi:hypothetical protein
MTGSGLWERPQMANQPPRAVQTDATEKSATFNGTGKPATVNPTTGALRTDVDQPDMPDGMGQSPG